LILKARLHAARQRASPRVASVFYTQQSAEVPTELPSPSDVKYRLGMKNVQFLTI